VQLFYVDPKEPALLPEEEAQHCLRTLRHKVGDIIYCVDGNGNLYQCRIAQIEKLKVHLSILGRQINWGEHNCQIHLFFPPLKSKERLEWLIEKSVELGVTHLHPILTSRSERSVIAFSRLERIMIAAMKQAKRSRLPSFSPLLLLRADSYLPRLAISFVAHCSAATHISQWLQNKPNPGWQSVGIAIGPEGDFSEEEVKILEEQGFRSVSLGSNRLRSETAGIFILSALKNIQGY
jgi:16S rRNA (uracil1498-N3)-methyltransferase